jgi:hypothetical protein
MPFGISSANEAAEAMPGVSSGGARVGAFGGGVLRELLAVGCWLGLAVGCRWLLHIA